VITVTVNNPPGTARDWVGLYAVGAGDSAFVDWNFLNGQKTLPAAGQTGAVTLQFPAPAQPGNYQFRLFNNGYTLHATSVTVFVGTSPSSGATITVNTPNVAAGQTIEIVIANGPGRTNDWVGIYTLSSTDYGFQDWFFLNGLKTLPATGSSNITVRFPAPAVAGVYEIRLMTNGYTKLVTSSGINVSQ
jgi:hypothetical protein